MNWYQWKQANSHNLQHVAGFELAFVEKVLEQIPDITPSDVIAQYHFKDDNGKNRYIDFMIINEDKGYCLPIELDGYSKMVGNEDNYYRFNDFLERQNCIIKKFEALLRYSNKRMLNQPQQVANEIRDMLRLQAGVMQLEACRHDEMQQTIDEYKRRLECALTKTHSDYKQEIATLKRSNSHKLLQVKALQEQLQAQQNKPAVMDYSRSAGFKDWWWIIRKTDWGTVIISIIIGLIILSYAVNNL